MEEIPPHKVFQFDLHGVTAPTAADPCTHLAPAQQHTPTPAQEGTPHNTPDGHTSSTHTETWSGFWVPVRVFERKTVELKFVKF